MRWIVLAFQMLGIVVLWAFQTLIILWLYGMGSGVFFIGDKNEALAASFERNSIIFVICSFALHAVVLFFIFRKIRRDDAANAARADRRIVFQGSDE